MAKIGAFEGLNFTNIKEKAEEAMIFLFNKIGGIENCPLACYRKSESSRLNAKTDQFALWGWRMVILSKALEKKLPAIYNTQAIKKNRAFFQGLISLSTLRNGHYDAIEYLARHGIVLIFLQHLKNTYLDGISFITKEGMPVIGITLRYNRIDHFWFTLLHEIAHVMKHIDCGNYIADDMSLRGSHGDSVIEKEADHFAEETLLPGFRFDEDYPYTSLEIYNIANHYNVHPAIVAGRIQHALNNYKLFANIINKEKIERMW